jgi:hypothetical protein
MAFVSSCSGLTVKTLLSNIYIIFYFIKLSRFAPNWTGLDTGVEIWWLLNEASLALNRARTRSSLRSWVSIFSLEIRTTDVL